MVLFLYVVMLLNLQKKELRRQRYGQFIRVVSLFALPALLFGFYVIIDYPVIKPAFIRENFGSIRSVGLSLLGLNAAIFELVSLVLLVGILGVVVLTPKRKVGSK